MEPIEFLAAVLPSTGIYCAVELDNRVSPAKPRHAYKNSVPDMLDATYTWKHDIYFALATFKANGNRKKPNVLALRSLFLDLDCGQDKAENGKGYLNKAAAVAALHEFLKVTGFDSLGSPWLNDSGGGVHAYWPLTAGVPVELWQPAADAFKKLCIDHGLIIDEAVPADPVRILRIPGTTNFGLKGGVQYRPAHSVDTVDVGSVFDFNKIKELLKLSAPADIVPVSTLGLKGVKPTAPGTLTGAKIALMDNSETRFEDIIKRPVATGCGQIQYYLLHATEQNMEPLWRANLSWADKCIDGVKSCEILTDMHPYDRGLMHKKLNDIKENGGPYSCSATDKLHAGICPSCPHWGKITNPLALGRSFTTSIEPKKIALDTSALTINSNIDIKTGVGTVIRSSPPRGFSYGDKGGVFRNVGTTDLKTKITTYEEVMVLPYDLFAIDLLNQNGTHYVHMIAMRPEGSIEITIPQRLLLKKEELLGWLANNNIVALHAGVDHHLYTFVRDSCQEISSSRGALKIPDHCGWQEDNSFVINSRIYTTKGITKMPMPDLENINRACVPLGELAKWRKLMDFLQKRQMYDLMCFGLAGFGAPLYRFTKMTECVTFHFGSTYSGTGKSLALNMVSSIWGNPAKFRIPPDTSDTTMFGRAGRLHSLPFVVDEATTKIRRDPEWYPEFAFKFSSSGWKLKTDPAADKERLNTSFWSSIAVMSSNTHPTEYMTGARKHSSLGELQRTLAINVWKELENFSEDDTKAMHAIHENYGVAGEIFAQFMVDNFDLCERTVMEVKNAIKPHFKDNERMWHSAVAACIAGGILAGKAGIVQLPIDKLLENFIKIVEANRALALTSVRTVNDVVVEYLRDNAKGLLLVRPDDVTKMKVVSMSGYGRTLADSIRGEITGRVEVGVKSEGWVDMFVEENVMKKWCSAMSFSYLDFKSRVSELENTKVTFVKKNLLADTHLPEMRVNVICISKRESDMHLAEIIPEEVQNNVA
jgi:hypothetical protein